jgi:hypothetical protein
VTLTSKLFVHDGNVERILELDEEQMEWILNSLRLMQEKQQELAAAHNDKHLTADDVMRTKGKEFVLAEGAEPVDLSKLFQEQYHDVTKLREELVQLIGRDLTDG